MVLQKNDDGETNEEAGLVNHEETEQEARIESDDRGPDHIAVIETETVEQGNEEGEENKNSEVDATVHLSRERPETQERQPGDFADCVSRTPPLVKLASSLSKNTKK